MSDGKDSASPSGLSITRRGDTRYNIPRACGVLIQGIVGGGVRVGGVRIDRQVAAG